MIGTFAHVHNGGTVGLEARQGKAHDSGAVMRGYSKFEVRPGKFTVTATRSA